MSNKCEAGLTTMTNEPQCVLGVGLYVVDERHVLGKLTTPALGAFL
jgi:hypothetical protein